MNAVGHINLTQSVVPENHVYRWASSIRNQATHSLRQSYKTYPYFPIPAIFRVLRPFSSYPASPVLLALDWAHPRLATLGHCTTIAWLCLGIESTSVVTSSHFPPPSLRCNCFCLCSTSATSLPPAILICLLV